MHRIILLYSFCAAYSKVLPLPPSPPPCSILPFSSSLSFSLSSFSFILAPSSCFPCSFPLSFLLLLSPRPCRPFILPLLSSFTLSSYSLFSSFHFLSSPFPSPLILLLALLFLSSFSCSFTFFFLYFSFSHMLLLLLPSFLLLFCPPSAQLQRFPLQRQRFCVPNQTTYTSLSSYFHVNLFLCYLFQLMIQRVLSTGFAGFDAKCYGPRNFWKQKAER